MKIGSMSLRPGFFFPIQKIYCWSQFHLKVLWVNISSSAIFDSMISNVLLCFFQEGTIHLFIVLAKSIRIQHPHQHLSKKRWFFKIDHTRSYFVNKVVISHLSTVFSDRLPVVCILVMAEIWKIKGIYHRSFWYNNLILHSYILCHSETVVIHIYKSKPLQFVFALIFSFVLYVLLFLFFSL